MDNVQRSGGGGGHWSAPHTELSLHVGAQSRDTRSIKLTWSRLASSHTMKASLPPSSSTTGVRLPAAASMTCGRQAGMGCGLWVGSRAGRPPAPPAARGHRFAHGWKQHRAARRWPRLVPAASHLAPDLGAAHEDELADVGGGDQRLPRLAVPRHNLDQVGRRARRRQRGIDDALVVPRAPGGVLRHLG